MYSFLKSTFLNTFFFLCRLDYVWAGFWLWAWLWAMVHRWRLLLWLLVSAVQFLDYLLLTASWNIYYYGPALSVSVCQSSCQAFWRQVLVGAGAWYSVLCSFTGYRFPILKGPAPLHSPHIGKAVPKLRCLPRSFRNLKARMPNECRWIKESRGTMLR